MFTRTTMRQLSINHLNFGKGILFGGRCIWTPIFITINGTKTVAELILPLYTWSHIAATANQNIMKLYVDGQEVAAAAFEGTVDWIGLPLMVGPIIRKERHRLCSHRTTKYSIYLWASGLNRRS